MSQDPRELLRQQLLELHFDLLDESDANSLREAIEDNPDVAAEWQRVQDLAGKIADVSRLQSVSLSTDATVTLPAVTSLAVTRATTNESSPTSGSVMSVRRAKAWKWATGIAATAAMLGWLSIGSLYFARIPAAPQAALRVQASQVPEALARNDHEFLVTTSAVNSAASFTVTPASLSFSVLSRGDVLFSGTARTDSEGNAKISLPRQLLVPPDAKLQLTARAETVSVASSSLEVPLRPSRCVTHVATDRPVYRPGERILFRSLTLLRSTFAAASEFPIRFELIGPDGAPVTGATLEGVTQHGVGNGSFLIPRDAVAGAYALSVTSLDGLFPQQQCRIEVRHFRTPRFSQEVRFTQRGYVPGDRVEAHVQVARVTGEPWGESPIRISAWVDDRAVHDTTVTTSAQGTASIVFRLPASTQPTRASLTVMVQDGDERETHETELPLQRGEIELQVYPEGGYLVEGLTNRVYFTAVDTAGQPAALTGQLIDDSGNLVVNVASSRDGMGRFEFRPERGQSYRLELASPSNRTSTVLLPAAVDDLPVLDTGTSVFDGDQPIELTVRSQRSRALRIQAVCRGRIVADEAIEVAVGDQQVQLPIESDTSGVIRITLLDAESRPGRPLMERLVFRRSSKRMHIEVQGQTDVLRRVPGESLGISLQVRDEAGNPLTAVLGVSVVDEAVLGLDRTDRPSMSTQLKLLSEIENPERLEDADFYLSDDPEATIALDLLLGTQGWRRFLSPALAESNDSFREQLVRLLALDGELGAESSSFDNASLLAKPWMHYQQAIDQAWKRLWLEARYLLLVIGAIWMLVWWIQRRKVASSVAGTSLAIAIATLWIEGCGMPAPTSSATSAAVESSPPLAAADSSSGDRASPTISQDRVAVDGEQPAESADEVVRGAAFEFFDWLDADKAAWLLRIANEDDGSSPVEGTAESADNDRSALTRESLRHLMQARGRSAEEFADEIIQAMQFPVRQYAHRRDANQVGERDLAETLFWHPLLITDAQGNASLKFDLPDSVTTFRLQVDGHTSDSRIGSASAKIQTSAP